MPKTLLHVFPTFVAAGSQQRTVQLMAGFADRYRHRIVALDGRSEALELVPDTVDASLVWPPHTGGWLSGVRAFRTLFNTEQPDAILTYNWGSFDAVIAARVQGRKAHVHHEDGFNVDEAEKQKQRRVLARRAFLRGAHRVIAPSQKLVDIALETWKLPPERVQLISNGVHLERFTKDAPSPDGSGEAIRRRLEIPAAALVVGAVGHLRPVKNYARLFAACARLPEELADPGVHVLLLGDGPERAALEEAARAQQPPGGRVHFAGHQDDLAPYYRAMDVFTISSDSEQQPISLLEAMAVGLPTASTDVGDVGACIGPQGSEYVVDLEGDCEAALAQAIGKLLADDELRRHLGQAAERRAREEYSFEAMLTTYGDVYESALAAGS